MNPPLPGELRRTSRRDFVVRSSILVSAGLLSRSLLNGQAPSVPASPAVAPTAPRAMPPLVTEFRPLRAGAGLFTGRGGTIGWLSTKDALVVVDTQFPESAAACLAGLPDRGDRRIDVVLNTHHHGDHTSGNGTFKPAAQSIVAHANVPRLMRAAAEKAGTVGRATLPDTTFTDAWRRDFGSEAVAARYFGPAHTSGDVVIHFEQANVVHLGDLMFNRLYPVIDRPGGASIRGWVARLETVVKTYPADAIYIFGHGSKNFGVTGGHADILAFRDYLTALLEHVQREIAAGKPKDQIVALENFPGFPDLHAPLPNRLGMNLSVAYDEITTKGG